MAHSWSPASVFGKFNIWVLKFLKMKLGDFVFVFNVRFSSEDLIRTF